MSEDFNLEEIENEAVTPNYYANIIAPVRYCKKLTANEKLLYGEISALCNQKGYCWATNGYFAKLYDVANETVSRWVKNLEKEGFIGSVVYIRKEGSRRIIKLSGGYEEKINPPLQKHQGGMTKKSMGVDENVKHNTTINTTANTNQIKIGTASFFDLTAIINTVEYSTIFNTVMAKRKNKEITADQFIAVLSDKYSMTEFKDRNHFINALNKTMRVLEGNKAKGNRTEKPNSGMVY